MRLDLQVPDDRDAKFDLIYRAAALPDGLPPVYVRSHSRAHALRTYQTMPWLQDYATLVVAQSQYAEYRAAFPTATVISIPAGYGGSDAGPGRATQFILEMTSWLGLDHVLVLDDDIIRLGPLYASPAGKGRASQAWARIVGERRQEFYRGCLTLLALCAEEAYAVHPDAVIAGPQLANPLRDVRASSRRWQLNQGGNPAQVQSWRPERLWQLTDGGIDLRRFNLHGDDIALTVAVLRGGGQVVAVPALTVVGLDYDTSSVVRTPQNAHLLRQAEHDGLMADAVMAPYIKTQYDVLDRPTWHVPDWRLLKRHGLAKSDVTLWSDPMRGLPAP